MQSRYEEEFVESAVMLCATGRRPGAPALQVTRFHRERERRYAILDPDERNAAFFRLHLEWFREWGLEEALNRVVAEYPVLPNALEVLAFRQARNRNEEGAELYVNAAGGRHGVIAFRSERWLREADLAAFLRHELMHLADMVDPVFGYSPRLDLGRGTAIEQRLVRERYRVLWAVTIDGRLDRAGRSPMADRAQRQAEFDRAFSFWPESRRQEVFAALWTDPAPTHPGLLAWAADPRALRSTRQPSPGGSCPLCDFPTFHWVAAAGLNQQVIAAIRAEFSSWTPDQGLCNRCAEVYESARFPAPANLCV
jgi:hypothetical protein